MSTTETGAALAALVKPRIVALLCLTGVSATLAAGGLAPLALVGFTAAGDTRAGGAAATNCWYDRDIDRLMARTADRPLARGDLSSPAALAFAGLLLAAGTVVGLLSIPAVSVAFMWLGAAAYVLVYTVGLKRRHWAATVVGGSAGSFPVLAGWSAVRPLETPALVMAALVFAWTPAHAWALAQVYRADFAAAGVPKLPVVTAPDVTPRRAAWAALATVAVAAGLLPLSGAAYATAFLGAVPAYLLAYRHYRRVGSDASAVRAFFTSNLFLAVLCVAWGVDGVTGDLHPATLLVAPAVFWLFARLWRAQPALDGVPGAVSGTWPRLAAGVPAWLRRHLGV